MIEYAWPLFFSVWSSAAASPPRENKANCKLRPIWPAESLLQQVQSRERRFLRPFGEDADISLQNLTVPAFGQPLGNGMMRAAMSLYMFSMRFSLIDNMTLSQSGKSIHRA